MVSLEQLERMLQPTQTNQSRGAVAAPHLFYVGAARRVAPFFMVRQAHHERVILYQVVFRDKIT